MKDLKEQIEQLRERAVKAQGSWQFPNEIYIETNGAIMACDEILEYIESLSSQIEERGKEVKSASEILRNIENKAGLTVSQPEEKERELTDEEIKGWAEYCATNSVGNKLMKITGNTGEQLE